MVFDVHAYNAWMGDSGAEVEARIRSVQDKGCGLLFAECGVSNIDFDLDPTNFLKAVTRPARWPRPDQLRPSLPGSVQSSIDATDIGRKYER